MTITLPAAMADAVRGAVETGDYATSSEVVREALRAWKLKRASKSDELAALKGEIDQGLADIAAGRVKNLDADLIVARGKTSLVGRSTSA